MKIVIKDESIRLSQLLKKASIIGTGGEAKYYVANNVIKINGKIAEGRNSKILVGSTVWINDDLYQIVGELE